MNTQTKQFYDYIMQKYRRVNDSSDKVHRIMEFMKKHMQRVGHEQAIKDFQYSLNILNSKRKNFGNEYFQQLKEDGDFGLKTYACIDTLCKFAPEELIYRTIKNAAITNVIFDTKNKKNINTARKIEFIRNDLKGESHGR